MSFPMKSFKNWHADYFVYFYLLLLMQGSVLHIGDMYGHVRVCMSMLRGIYRVHRVT